MRESLNKKLGVDPETYQITTTDCKEWNTYPHQGAESETSWYGLNNIQVWEPGSYTPAPPYPVMYSMVELEKVNAPTISALALSSVTKTPAQFEFHRGPRWNYTTYHQLVDWLSETQIPPPYAGFKMDIYDIKNQKQSIKATKLLTHLVGWCYHLIIPLFRINMELKRKLDTAFPPNWGQGSTKHEGRWTEIVDLAKTLAPLEQVPYPKDVVPLFIKFFKADNQTSLFTQGKLILSRDNPSQASKFYSPADRTRLGNFFRAQFPHESEKAANIITDETLPFYQWQGIFVHEMIERVRALGISDIQNANAWKAIWPLTKPSAMQTVFTFIRYKQRIYPPFFHPPPDEELTTFLLDNVATLPAGEKTAKWTINAQQARLLIACFSQERGWLKTAHSDEKKQLIDTDDVNSRNSKIGLSYLAPYLHAYAIAFRNHIAGRDRSVWIWDAQGNLKNATPADKFRSCQMGVAMKQEQEDFSGPYAGLIGSTGSHMDYLDLDLANPDTCVATNIPGWGKPWTMTEDALRDFILITAPAPKIRLIKDAEDSGEYNQKVKASIGDYEKWRDIILDNPAKLNPVGGFPIGCKMGINEKGDPFYNLYPDYGVWDLGNEGTFLHFIGNPYRDFYGNYAYQDTMRIGAKCLDFIREQFKKTTNTVGEGFKDLYLPILVTGGVAVAVMLAYSEAKK